MMLFMGGMMWMMMRGMGGSSPGSSSPPEGPATEEINVEILSGTSLRRGRDLPEDYETAGRCSSTRRRVGRRAPGRGADRDRRARRETVMKKLIIGLLAVGAAMALRPW